MFLVEGMLHLPRRPLADKRFVADVRDNLHADIRDVSIRAGDGVQLHGWYSEPKQQNGSAVILLHGMGDNRSGAAGYAKLFLIHGYRVLLPDSRAHGESGGIIATYGVIERYDIHRWIVWLKAQTSGGCVYGFGESMGAALMLQSLATDPPLCAVAAESPFSTFRQIAYDRISDRIAAGRWFGPTLGRIPIELAFLYTRFRYGVNLSDASPLHALSNSNVPLLLIHGAADDNIRPRHSQLLFKAASSHAKLWIVSGAGHTGAWAISPSEFERIVLGWFTAHTRYTQEQRVASH